jgi:hypothetical protein
MYEYIRILLGARPILPISRLKFKFALLPFTLRSTSGRVCALI